MYRSFVRYFSLCNRLQKSIKKPIPVFGIEGRYVSALYSAASQMKQLEEVDKTLNELQKVLTKPKIKDFLNNSMISRSFKAKLLTDCGKSAGMPQAALNFLALVAENGRLNLLRRIIKMFHTVMMVHRSEAICEVITAEHLDDETRSALLDILKKFIKEGQKIRLIESLDPDIIGGFAVVIEDKHIDLCIKSKVVFYSDILKRNIL